MDKKQRENNDDIKVQTEKRKNILKSEQQNVSDFSAMKAHEVLAMSKEEFEKANSPTTNKLN